MQTDSERDDTLMRYLRGELAEAERDRVEAAYFADDRLHQRLLMLEDQMMDAYVRGELSPEEAERFSRRVENSPEQRRRVAFAEALRRMAAREPDAPRHRWWADLLGWLPVQTPALRMALAAAALVLVAGPLIYLRYASRGGTSPGQATVAQRQSPARTPDTTPPRAAPVLAFVLLPVERSGGEENRVAIPAGEYTIRLRMDFEDGGAEGLSAAVQTAEGVKVDQIDGLESSSIGPGRRAAFVSLPASRLPDGQYVMRLSHKTADGTTELFGGYTFRVEHAR